MPQRTLSWQHDIQVALNTFSPLFDFQSFMADLFNLLEFPTFSALMQLKKIIGV